MTDKELLRVYNKLKSLLAKRSRVFTKIMFSKDETEITLLNLKLLSIEKQLYEIEKIIDKYYVRINELLKEKQAQRNDKRKIKRTN